MLVHLVEVASADGECLKICSGTTGAQTTLERLPKLSLNVLE